MIRADKTVMPIIKYIADYSSDYAEKKLLSGKKLTELPSKKYVDDISKAFNEMMLIYYLYGRLKINESLKKEIAKYDKKEAEKIKFAEVRTVDEDTVNKDNISDYIGKQYRPNEAINNLINQLKLKDGNIYKTRLNKEQLLAKARKIGILSYSDFVARVNTKLLVALDSGTPYKEFIRLLKADQVPGMSLKDVVNMNGYWTTVARTNSSTIFHAGYLDQMEEVKEFIEYEQYNAVIKDHEQCKALDGIIRPVGEFEANGNTIPAGFNCTAYFSIVSKVRAEAQGIKETKNWDSSVKPDTGFGGKTTTKKVCNLPKDTEKRLPKNYKTLM